MTMRPRFRIEPRDVPADCAARRLGMTLGQFNAALRNLIAQREFPKPDPDTGNYDLNAIDRWCDSRHPRWFGPSEPQARDASTVVKNRIAAMRRGAV